MKEICLVPFYKSQLSNNIFDDKSKLNRDNVLEPYVILHDLLYQNGYKINTSDITPISKADSIIFLRMDILKIIKCKILRKHCIYVQFEPPVVVSLHNERKIKMICGLFDVILTWNDNLIDNARFVKFYFPVPFDSSVIQPIEFYSKKLLTNISGYKLSSRKNELYSKRIEAIKYFERELGDDFEFYGIGWGKREFPSYKGEITSKKEVLKNFKFSLCFENEKGLNGLISEKIFDCFSARTIPIFWGAENIEKYIPKECFIDFRDFESFNILKEYISSMSKGEYDLRIAAIEDYLLSEEFKRHSSINFAQTVMDAVTRKPRKSHCFLTIFSILYYLVYVGFEKLRIIRSKLMKMK